MTRGAAAVLAEPNIPDTVHTWQDLVLWLADTYHHGKVYPMAKRTRTSAGTVRQWADGIIQVPKLETALAVSLAYDVPQDVILRVARPKGPQPPVRDETGARIRTKAQAAARRQALAAIQEAPEPQDGAQDRPAGMDTLLAPPGAA